MPAWAGDKNPSALWQIVHGKCAIHPEKAPVPCAVYDAKGGYAVLHSLEGRGQYLLIPTVRMAGMESAGLLDPKTPNYFADAWAQRQRVSMDYGVSVPREDLSLAINSVLGRTQDQLHIHIDCVRGDVKRALAAHLPSVGEEWAYFPVALAGRRYRARWIEGDVISGSPFRLLAASLPDPAAEMGSHTLVMVPEMRAGRPGFVLLDDHVHGLDRASGEVLQDHACGVLRGG